MTTMAERAERFVELHRQGCFIVPNPWDRGSAVLLAGQGFQALASSSAGHAFALGLPDGGLGRDRTLAPPICTSEVPLSNPALRPPLRPLEGPLSGSQ